MATATAALSRPHPIGYTDVEWPEGTDAVAERIALHLICDHFEHSHNVLGTVAELADWHADLHREQVREKALADAVESALSRLQNEHAGKDVKREAVAHLAYALSLYRMHEGSHDHGLGTVPTG